MTREELIATLGAEIVRFQDASNEMDEAAASVLALERPDLQLISMLLFGGSLPLEQLAGALKVTRPALSRRIARLELAGYVHLASGRVVELTGHARGWVETIWGPIGMEGVRLLARETTESLQLMLRFMQAVHPMHAAHAERVRAMLAVPAPRRANRMRGGLSPAALRRVQLFVEANLSRPLPLSQLAERASLSAFYFARAFRQSTGTTPRAFVETRRIEKAQQFLRESDLSLAAIAHETGLGTQSRFTTTFRRATGFTPAAYRKG